MKKLFVATILAVVASAGQWVQQYTNEAEPRQILFSEGIIDVQYDYFFDIAYKLQYKSELDENNSGLQRDIFGFNMHSKAKTQFYITLFDIFAFDFRFEIIPFDITPLDMSLTYNRLGGILRGDPLAIVFEASHNVEIMNIVSTWRKDIKLPHVSLFDVADGENILDDVVYPKLKFQETDEFVDSLLSINLFDVLIAQKYPDYTKWYGQGTYCNFDFINDW